VEAKIHAFLKLILDGGAPNFIPPNSLSRACGCFYTRDRSLYGPQGQSGHCGEKEALVPLPGMNHGRPALSHHLTDLPISGHEG